MLFTAADIAKQLEGEVIGEAVTPITGFAPADSAKAGDLTFAENEDYFGRAEKSAASAILVNGTFSSSGKVLIRVSNGCATSTRSFRECLAGTSFPDWK